MRRPPLVPIQRVELNLEGLEHRQFVWGESDCFSLVRDFYKQNFSIEIRDYARPSNWQADVLNLILAGFQKEGFEKLTTWKLDDLRPGDVMCMCVGESNPNHFGVYTGNNEFIHHLSGNMSSVSPLKGHWLHHTSFLLRHPDVPDLRPNTKDITIQELLRARYPDQAGSSPQE